MVLLLLMIQRQRQWQRLSLNSLLTADALQKIHWAAIAAACHCFRSTIKQTPEPGPERVGQQVDCGGFSGNTVVTGGCVAGEALAPGDPLLAQSGDDISLQAVGENEGKDEAYKRVVL